MRTVPDDYQSDPFIDVRPRRAAVPDGHAVVGGLTSGDLPIALVVPERDAPRFRRQVAARRMRAAIRQRLVAIIDDPATGDHPERSAERAVLLAYANADAAPRNGAHRLR